MSKLQKILEDCTSGRSMPIRSYSGRWMYGRECLGVVLPSGFGPFLSALVGGLKKLEPMELERLAQEIEIAQTDSLGMDIILYFPKVAYDR